LGAASAGFDFAVVAVAVAAVLLLVERREAALFLEARAIDSRGGAGAGSDSSELSGIVRLFFCAGGRADIV